MTSLQVSVLTCVPWLLTHFVDFIGLDRRLLGSVIFQLKLSTFVQSTAKVRLPFRWVGFIHTFLIFTGLQSPRLQDTMQGSSTIFTFTQRLPARHVERL